MNDKHAKSHAALTVSAEPYGVSQASVRSKITACPKPLDVMSRLDQLDPYWIWFAELKGIPLTVKWHLIDHFKTPKDLYFADGHDLPPLRQSNTPAAVNNLISKLASQKSLESAKRIAEKSARLGIQMLAATGRECLTPASPLTALPFVLYVLGELVEGPSAAVVGTRKATGEGYDAAESVCQELAAEGICINSGMAHGIDSFAHQFALAEGRKTQGFAAHGLDVCYPSEHYNLMRRLTESGAVLSPFPVGTQPYRANFLKRNALMSLWSDEVILVEAGLKSGAMDTALHAVRQGRRLWVVAGSHSSENCAGNRWLLESGRAEAFSLRGGLGENPALVGACQTDRVRVYENNPDPTVTSPDDGLSVWILKVLRQMPMRIETLMERLDGIELLQLEDALLELEKKKRVVYQPDGRWHYSGW